MGKDAKEAYQLRLRTLQRTIRQGSNNKSSFCTSSKHAGSSSAGVQQLMTAIRHGRLGDVRYLLNNSAHTSRNKHLLLTYESRDHMLEIIINSGQNEEMTRELLHSTVITQLKRVAINAHVLACAVKRGDLVTLELILQYGAVVGGTDNTGTTPLRQAIQGTHIPELKLLLSYGAQVTLPDLCAATRAGHVDMVRVLMKAAQPGILDTCTAQEHPIITAAAHNHVPLVDVYRQHTDINSLYGTGEAKDTAHRCAALHAAAQHAHVETVQFILLRFNGDGRVVDTHGCTALHALVNTKHHAAAMRPVEDYIGVAQTLVNAGVDVRKVNNNGETALHLAARNGHHRVAEFILQHDVHALKLANKKGKLAVQCAKKEDEKMKEVFRKFETIYENKNKMYPDLSGLQIADTITENSYLQTSAIHNLTQNHEMTAPMRYSENMNAPITEKVTHYKTVINLTDVQDGNVGNADDKSNVYFRPYKLMEKHQVIVL